MASPSLQVVGAVVPEAPYPDSILARGWSFDLDLAQIDQSDTWTLAPAELRPWLLMLWSVSWKSAPCGTYPDSDALIAARIGMPLAMFQTHRAVLMRGWVKHADGRLYHDTITDRVLRMIHMRAKDRQRVAQSRIDKNQSVEQNVRPDSGVTPGGVHAESEPVRDSPSPSPKEKTPRGVAALIGAAWKCPADVDPDAWLDWLKVRKAKRAATSERALRDVVAVLDAIRSQGGSASAAVARSANKGWTDVYMPPAGTLNSAATMPKQGTFGAFDTTGILGPHNDPTKRVRE